MNTNKRSIQLAGLFAFVLALTAVTWARKFGLTPGDKVPAASGEINTSTDKNGNTKVDLKVQNLALPGTLNPPATVYVVWFQSQDSQPENEGEIKVHSNLKGELKARTPSKNFEVLVTAETNPLVKTPSGTVVLRTKVTM